MDIPLAAPELPDVRPRPVLPEALAALQARFGAQLSTALAVREQHGRDESAFTHVPPPAAVLFAKSTQDVVDAVRLAAQWMIPVMPYGIGSSLEGQLLAVQGGLSLDLSRMNRVLAVHADDLTATVQPGVTRQQLNEAVRHLGLFFPIDPGADATLGGMAATRASGTNAVRYGTMRDNVLALEVVTASGAVVRTGTRAQEQCRLRPEAPVRWQRRHAWHFHRDHAAAVSAARGGCGGGGLVSERGGGRAHDDGHHPDGRADRALRAAGCAHRARGQPPQPAGAARGADAADGIPRLAHRRARAAETVQALVAEHGGQAFEWASTPEERTRLWTARHHASFAVVQSRPGCRCTTRDVCVPISQLADHVTAAVAEADAAGLPYFLAGHVGDGNFHMGYLINPDDAGERARAEALIAALVQRAIAGGSPCTGEHGVGLHKMDFLRAETGEDALALMRAIKRALDPTTSSNLGKVLL